MIAGSLRREREVFEGSFVWEAGRLLKEVMADGLDLAVTSEESLQATRRLETVRPSSCSNFAEEYGRFRKQWSM